MSKTVLSTLHNWLSSQNTVSWVQAQTIQSRANRFDIYRLSEHSTVTDSSEDLAMTFHFVYVHGTWYSGPVQYSTTKKIGLLISNKGVISVSKSNLNMFVFDMT